MPTKLERLIGIGERLISTGHTRLLATLVAIGAFSGAFYLDRPRGLYYAAGIVIVVVIFIIVKTIGDCKQASEK